MPKPKKYWAVVDHQDQIESHPVTGTLPVYDEEYEQILRITYGKYRVIPVAIVPYEEVEHEDR